MKLTEDIAIAVLLRERHRRGFALPRFCPKKWWECDVFSVTKAGYLTEFEVKLTRSDFFEDAKKEHQVLPHSWGTPVVMENKHALLDAGSERGPSRFFYVTPPGMVKVEELPLWAGLIELEPTPGGSRVEYSHREVEKKPAPKLHKAKVATAVMEHARSVCYWRMHDLACRLAGMKAR